MVVSQPTGQISASATNKKFVLINQCCDPAVPVCYMTSDVLASVMKIYKRLVKEEKRDGLVGGSEFEFKIYELTSESKAQVMLTENDSYSNKPYIYNLSFTNAAVIEEFSYMDLAAFNS